MKAPLSPAAPQMYIVRESTASWLALEIEKCYRNKYTTWSIRGHRLLHCDRQDHRDWMSRWQSCWIAKQADINALPNRPCCIAIFNLCPQASRSSMTKTSVTKRTLLRQGLSWCISKFTYLHHTLRNCNTISSESGLIILLPPHLRRLQLQFQFAKCTKTSGANVSRCRSHTVLARNDSESNLRLLN